MKRSPHESWISDSYKKEATYPIHRRQPSVPPAYSVPIYLSPINGLMAALKCMNYRLGTDSFIEAFMSSTIMVYLEHKTARKVNGIAKSVPELHEKLQVLGITERRIIHFKWGSRGLLVRASDL